MLLFFSQLVQKMPTQHRWMLPYVQFIHFFLNTYFKVWKKTSGDFSHHHSKIMQFDWFLSLLEQKQQENHEIYYIGLFCHFLQQWGSSQKRQHGGGRGQKSHKKCDVIYGCSHRKREKKNSYRRVKEKTGSLVEVFLH